MLVFTLAACTISAFTVRPGVQRRVPKAMQQLVVPSLTSAVPRPVTDPTPSSTAVAVKKDDAEASEAAAEVPQWVYALGALALLSVPHFLYHAN